MGCSRFVYHHFLVLCKWNKLKKAYPTTLVRLYSQK
ncbi:hypothetical protein [Oceanobacillus sp. AG]|nr:hypothetical protein [Oceanobacillus sp. AG]